MKLSQNDAKGFSLVEVTLALGIAAFCLVPVFGLLPVGLNCNQAATNQTAISGIQSAVIADLRATPLTTPRGNAAISTQYAIPIPASTTAPAAATTTLFFKDNGEFTTKIASDSHYCVNVNFLPGAANAPNMALITTTWPAAAGDPLTASQHTGSASGTSVQTFVALSRN